MTVFSNPLSFRVLGQEQAKEAEMAIRADLEQAPKGCEEWYFSKMKTPGGVVQKSGPMRDPKNQPFAGFLIKSRTSTASMPAERMAIRPRSVSS
jgi:hypothetical protein